MRQERGAAKLGLLGVRWVVLEKVALVLEGDLDVLLGLDVLLTAVDDGDVAEAERDNATREDVDHVCSLVHDVDLREDTDGALACK